MNTIHPKLPKYVRVVEDLRAQIAAGTLGSEARLPSVAELCREYGVSLGTLDKAYVHLENEGLIRREPGRGVFVAGRNEQRARTATLGYLDVGSGGPHPYWQHLVHGAQSEAARHGFQILLLREGAQTAWEKIDGVLFHGRATGDARPELPPGMCSVALLRPVAGAASVTADDYDGARQATRHLLELGHQRIALMSVHWDYWSQQREAGYRDALREAGITPDDKWIRTLHDGAESLSYLGASRGFSNFREHGFQTMSAWLRGDWETLGCTAILAHNDDCAVGIIEALRAGGRRVPEDVSVVGFDGSEITAYLQPRLTSVEVPLQRIGGAGVEMLLRLMESNGSDTPNVVMPVSLKPGGTTVPMRSPPPKVCVSSSRKSVGATC